MGGQKIVARWLFSRRMYTGILLLALVNDISAFQVDPVPKQLGHIADVPSASRNRTTLEACRREVIQMGLHTMMVLSAPLSIIGSPQVVRAANDDEVVVARSSSSEMTIVKARVTLAPGVDLQQASPSSSLYITCRPDKPDNVPAAILNGSRGKPPPVLSTKIVSPQFPIDVELVIPRDLTLEGAWDGMSSLQSGDISLQLPSKVDELWWNRVDLIVSARWDSDGVAATRSPEDLVGRGFWKVDENGEGYIVDIQLAGRGAFGKFATANNSKK